MYSSIKCFVSFLVGLIAISSLTLAQSVPTIISYQGRLTNSAGDPVPNRSYSVVFTIYDAPSGGISKWTETQSIATNSGLFSVLLGSVNPIKDSVFNTATRYLGITVGTDPEITPRTVFTNTPYAFISSNADSAKFADNVSDNSIDSTEILPGGISLSDIAQNNASSGQVMKWNGSVWVAGDDNSGSDGWTDDGTVVRLNTISDSVGIGTVTPSAKLDVAGDAVISGKATIGSGHINSGTNAFVAGKNNISGNTASTVSGGSLNFARGIYSTIAGGGGANLLDSNSALGDYTVIGGGSGNLAVGAYATVGGGRSNYSRGIFSTVSGGGSTWPSDSNSATGDYSSIGGGSANSATGYYATIGGGAANTASESYNTIGGGQLNSTVAFGGTIGGGQANTAGQYGTVGGGIANTASGLQSTIGGGRFNFARGDYSVVSGGGGFNEADSNSAIGVYSTIPGGTRNIAAGKYSFAAGRRAQANQAGTFVWADSTDADFASTAANQFLVRASGGVGIGTTAPSGELHVASSKLYSGFFTSDNLSYSTHVVHAEYNGNSGNADVVAVYGRSVPTDFYGIGGYFEGGYKGVSGKVFPTGTGSYRAVDGNANGGSGTNFGVRGYANGSGTNYAIYGEVGVSGVTNYAGYFAGDVSVTGLLTKGGGSFKIDHPLDPKNKYLYHSFVESPDMKNIYDGNITTDNNGYATVTLPDWFEALNKDFRYQLTIIGGFAQAVISQEIQNNRFTIHTDKPNVKVSWQVTGIRKDRFAEANRIPVEVDKPANERDTYLHPLAFGLSKSYGVDYQHQMEKRKKNP